MTRYTPSGQVNTIPQIQAELENIQTAINDALSRKGDTPNGMEADLDMNNNRILNLTEPTGDTEPVRKGDLATLIGSSPAEVLADTSVKTLTTDIQTSDLTGVNNVITAYDSAAELSSSASDKGGRIYKATGNTNVARQGTRILQSDLIYDQNGREFKPTEPWAFRMMWLGQSNAQGATSAGDGSQVIEDQVYTFSYGPTPTRGWHLAQFGQNPLPSTLSNNAGLHFANEIRRRTGRPVFMILTALGGTSINEWVGSGTSSSLFLQMTQALTDSGWPSSSIEAVGWMQGEADGDDQSTAYNSYGAYRAGLNTLFNQLQNLSQWSQNTMFIASGVGEWNDHPNPERNDVNQTLENDDDYPFATNVYTSGLIRNPAVGDESHFDGDSLVQLGLNMAEKYLTGKTANREIGPNNQIGPNVYGIYGSGQSVTLERTHLKGGTTVVSNNATITFPDKPYVWDGAIVTIDVTTTSSGRTTVNFPAGVGFDYKGYNYTGPMLLNKAGQWRFLSSQGKIKLIEKPFANANTALSYQNGTFTPLRWELENETFSTVNATINLPEPTLTDGPADMTGTRVTFFAFSLTGGNTILAIDGGATGKFVDSTRTVVDTITIDQTRGFVTLIMVSGFWVVESTNF